MKSRGGGDMFKSSGMASQSVVELPPISKNGLILEDADDVEYSVSAKGASRTGRKLLHSSSTERVSAPRIAKPTRQSDFGGYSWNVSHQNLAETKTTFHRQIRTVESLPLDKRKSPIESHVRPRSHNKQPGAKRQIKQQRSVPTKISVNTAASEPPSCVVGSTQTSSSSADCSKNGSSTLDFPITNFTPVNKESSKSTQSARSEKSIANDVSKGSTMPDKRVSTAARRRKVKQNDDFVIELFLKDEPPTKTIIDWKFAQDQLNGDIRAELKKATANGEETALAGNLTFKSQSPAPEKKVQFSNELNNTVVNDKLDETRSIESENSTIGKSIDPKNDAITDERSVTFASSVDRTASKFHEDVITPPEDVFITGSNLRSPRYESTPISIQEAVSLKKALFGDVRAVWSKAWLNHSFNMSGPFSIDLCHFAPSGILAALQAHYIQQHFFGIFKDESNVWKPTQNQKLANLVRAISTLLWKCGADNSLACFCNISSNVQYSSSTAMPHDGVTERVEIFRFNSENEISQFMSEFANQIISSKCASLALLYSVVLSRSAYSIRQDLLNKEEPLLVNYRCSPALISLLLTGVAAPCWMNDNSDLRLDPQLRRGISSRSNFGIFTTRKTKNTPYVVESNLKTPKLPIWIVEIPSGDIYSSKRDFQYSVLFCSNRRLVSDWKVERHFDLHWILACPYQMEKVKFTLDARCVINWNEFCEDDYHLVETAIRTKWPDVDVNWNGSNRCDFGFVPPSQTAVQAFKG